jgi:hypothetical protein
MTESEADRPEDTSADPSADILAGALLVSLATYVTVEALRMPPRGPLGSLTGPGLVPLILGAALGIMGAALLVGGLRRGGLLTLLRWTSRLWSPEASRLAAVVSLTGLFVLLIGRIPFWAANFAYFLLTFAYLRVGGGRPWRVLLYAVAMTLFVGVFLPRAFEMTLP